MLRIFNTVMVAFGISMLLVVSSYATEASHEETEKTPVYTADPSFVLKRVSFTGNTVYTDETLQQVVSPFIGQRIRSSDLEQLRIRLSIFYSDNGYLSSGAKLPDQNVVEGNVTFQIIEGQMDDNIEVTGSGRLKPDYISDRIRLGVEGPLNTRSLQQRFQWLLDDPLIDRMNGELHPIPGTNRSELKIKVTRARPFELNFSADNHQAPSVGAEQATLSGSIRNTGGYGDEWRFSVGAGAETVRLSIGSSYRLNARDTTLALDMSASQNAIIEEPFDNIDIESESWRAELALSHPIALGFLKQIDLGVGLSLKQNSNELLGIPFSFTAGEIDGQSRVSVLKLWQAYANRQSTYVTALRSTLNIGTTAFDATRHDGDQPDSQFVTWQGQGQYVRRLMKDKAEWRLRADAQLASQALLPLERFSVGGVATVRGYRENTLLRDEAVVMSSEFRYRFYQSAKAGSFQIAPFVDYGYGRNRGGNKNAKSLRSVGLGLLWSIDTRFSTELYYGHPMEKLANTGEENLQDRGVHFKLNASVW